MTIRHDSAGLERHYLLDMLAGAGGCVLEIGCGEGRLTRKYAELAARVVGIDLPAALPRAGAESLGECVSLAAASGARLPFASRCFDLAIFALSF